MHKIAVRRWSDLDDRSLAHALVAGVDLVIVRADKAAASRYPDLRF